MIGAAESLTEEFSGYLDSPMKFVPLNESEGSFVGGFPVFPFPSVEQDYSMCDVCREHSMIQVCQLAAPLFEQNRRSIHLFVCSKCKRSPGSWKVFRSQTQEPLKDDEPHDISPEPQETEKQCEEGTIDVALTSDVSSDNPFADLVAVRDKAAQQKKQENKKKKKKKPKKRVEKAKKKSVTSSWKDAVIEPWWLDVSVCQSKKKKNIRKNKSEKDIEEEERLLEKYGVDLDADFKTSKKNSEWKGESYEGSKESKSFRKFQKAMSEDPEKVIYYEMGAQPMWISEGKVFEKEPKCRGCGASCVFEFQLFPTFLFLAESKGLWKVRPEDVGVFLEMPEEKEEDAAVVVSEDNCPEVTEDMVNNKSGPPSDFLESIVLPSPVPDFGVVVVYTCSKSCQYEGGGVIQEHVFVQNAV